MGVQIFRRWGAVAAVAALALSVGVTAAPTASAVPADGVVRTFDSEPVGAPPEDCRVESGGVTIAEAAIGDAPASNRAMRITDQSATSSTRLWCAYDLSTQRSASFKLSPAQLDRAPIVAIQGAPGSSGNGVWRFTLNRSGDDLNITAYDGKTWSAVGTVLGGAMPGTWQDFTINATLDRAEVIVNGVRFQTQVRNAASTGMGDLYFSGAGLSAGGVDYYVDDLAVAGKLPDDAFAGVTIEPVLDDTDLVIGKQTTDAPIARFLLPEGKDVTSYSAAAQWGGETIPVTLSGPDPDGWVTASITHTFTRAGADTLRTVVTDAAGVRSVSAQTVSVAGNLSALTFESDQIGGLPADCSTPSGYLPAAVSDAQASEGNRSLRLHDTSTTASVGVTCTAPGQQGAYLRFEMNPNALQGFTFDLIGRSLVSTGQPANSLFRFAVRADGGIQWYDTSTTATWRELAPAGTVALDQWNQVEVAVPADHAAARVSVGGVHVGSAGSTIGNNSKTHNSVEAITGVLFSTSGSGAAGNNDDVFVDDVLFDTPDNTPDSAVGTAPFNIADAVTVDSGDSDLFGPIPPVVVQHDEGKRVLLGYAGHPDATNASGTLLAASDDGGSTWFDGKEFNAMPDIQGETFSTLRNGNLLAVNFHTYMVEGSGDRKAGMETAISSDGGKTWTHRTGLMTTPEPMSPLGPSERPGTTLGGFGPMHTVVEDPDGTLYMSAYGFYQQDTDPVKKYRTILMVSEDGGVNWSVRSTVATVQEGETGTSGPCEAALERLADGSLLMVMRNGWYAPMTSVRSYDNGVTWTRPEQIKVGPAAQNLQSVQPTLELLPTGELLLMVGRPGLTMLISRSGLGDDWTVPVGVDYANSENGAFVVLDPSTILVAGDRGRVKPFEIWSRRVTIDQPCDRVVTGTFDGPLTVGEGGLCLRDAKVNGSVTVSDGGRLIVQGSTIAGPVTTTRASTVSVCASTVTGPLQVTGTTHNVAIGDITSGCDPSTVSGPTTIKGTSGQVVIDKSEITGPLTVDANESQLATTLAGVVVHGPLSCSGNTVAPTDAGVPTIVGGAAKGQCKALG